MSDDPTPVETTAPETPEAEVTDAPTIPPPWGEDFQPERAWETIQKQRAREAELEPAAKTFKRLDAGEDLDTFKKLAEKYGFELPEVEEEPDEDEFDDDDPRDAQLKELTERQKAHDEWIAEQRQVATVRAFTTDLDEMLAEKGVELDEDDRALIFERSARIGQETKSWDRNATAKALDWLLGKYEKREQAAVERLKSSKRAPHVSPGGKPGSGPQPDLTTREGREALFKERLAQQQ